MLAHESPLLNFQRFHKFVLKYSHYLKLNYINTQLYIIKSRGGKYSKHQFIICFLC